MSKFKVGDRVRVNSTTICAQYIGKTGKIVADASLPLVGERYDVLFDGENKPSNYYWLDHELELVKRKSFTKNDLKDGMVVEYRCGWMELVLGKKTVDGTGSHSLCNFDDELINKDSRASDIMRVYIVNDDITNIDRIFDRACLTLLWEREEKPDYKEMTVAEIEEKLGYKVKVIGEKE